MGSCSGATTQGPASQPSRSPRTTSFSPTDFKTAGWWWLAILSRPGDRREESLSLLPPAGALDGAAPGVAEGGALVFAHAGYEGAIGVPVSGDGVGGGPEADG